MTVEELVSAAQESGVRIDYAEIENEIETELEIIVE